LVLIFVAASGQQQVGKNIADHLLIKSAQRDIHGAAEEEVIGSPYLNEKFSSGTVYTFNAKFTDVALRLNVYNNYIEFQQNDKMYILDPEPRIKKVTFDNKAFVVLKHDFKGKSELGYLQLLDSGKVMLLSKKVVLYRESRAPQALESSGTPARYTSAPDIYFYKIENGEAVRIESLKQVLESLPGHKESVATFIKREKISVKKEPDLTKLIKYYNSL
jgi:hypothetical protein